MNPLVPKIALIFSLVQVPAHAIVLAVLATPSDDSNAKVTAQFWDAFTQGTDSSPPRWTGTSTATDVSITVNQHGLQYGATYNFASGMAVQTGTFTAPYFRFEFLPGHLNGDSRVIWSNAPITDAPYLGNNVNTVPDAGTTVVLFAIAVGCLGLGWRRSRGCLVSARETV